MLALCREHRLEHRTKHIALRYFLARELQQRGQLRLAYVASEANTADIFTKALAPGDHQRFCTLLVCLALLDWSCFPTCTQLIASSIIPVSPQEQQLPLIEFAYNNSPSATTQQSPFCLNCRQDPTVPMTPNPDNPVPRAQQSFRISHMITPVTAHLLHLADWYISPSFHVGLLRPYVPSTSQLPRNRLASMIRPPTEPIIMPEKILSHRVRDPRGARRIEFLIRWKDLAPTEDNWVPLDKNENHPVLTKYQRSRNFQDVHALS
ncbi:unnamed protein product [Closterium sp. NIES-53]